MAKIYKASFDYEGIRKTIVRQRRKLHRSHADIASRAGISVDEYLKIETGETPVEDIPLGVFLKLYDAVGYTLWQKPKAVKWEDMEYVEN